MSETQIRITFFMVIMACIATWELIAPRRWLSVSKTERWVTNFSIIFLDSLFVKLLFPMAAVGVAAVAQNNNWGLFTLLKFPGWLSVLAGVLLLDLVIYLQHVMVHAVPLLWRLHMVHHADLDYDVTTGLRFHPLEILLSMVIKMIVVAGAGVPVPAVLIFEITLNGTAMFNHGNIYLPKKLDHYLRLLVVTPDMHRVHHSVIIRETNSNFGFNFPWWDRLFGTYRAQPVAGHEGMTIGIAPYRNAKQVTLFRLLILPFIGDAGHYSLKYTGRNPGTSDER